MFTGSKKNEVTAVDLAEEFEQAKNQFQYTVESISTDADARQQVVRNRLAVLEEEDKNLADLRNQLRPAVA